ncbi:MAG: SURF1 family protein [Gammaproteobacteria bacterium]
MFRTTPEMMRRFILFAVFGTVFALLSTLGFWQLHRAEEKRVRYDRFTARLSEAPLSFDMIEQHTPQAEDLWRRTEVSGRYLESQVLLDNRILRGQAGYEVLTPFVSESGQAVLINRGWIPLGGRRDRQVKLPVPTDQVTVRGFLGAEPIVGIGLPGANHGVERLGVNLIRIQRPELGEIAKVLSLELWPVLIYLDAGAPGALTVEFSPPGDGSTKHTAYAVQWFAMAAILALIGLWNLRRHEPDNGA